MEQRVEKTLFRISNGKWTAKRDFRGSTVARKRLGRRLSKEAMSIPDEVHQVKVIHRNVLIQSTSTRASATRV
eukprot:746531-Hanusia_phi.AAC.5